MRKVNFLNGFSTKMVLAVSLVAGLSLTGCEEETLDVTVPDITVTVPAPEVQDGVAYVNLSATSAAGNSLSDVVYTVNGEVVTSNSVESKGAETLEIMAEKDGYVAVIRNVEVPALQKNAFVVIPVNFVLYASEDEVVATEGSVIEDSENEQDPEEYTIDGANYLPGVWYTVNVPVPAGDYLSAEQKEDLLNKVEALEALETKAELSDEDRINLATAKGLLRAAINAYASEPSKVEVPVAFRLKEAAKTITFNINVTTVNFAIAFATEVAEKIGKVEGEATRIASVLVTAGAEGVEVDHTHGHGHGNDGNAGGGTTDVD